MQLCDTTLGSDVISPDFQVRTQHVHADNHSKVC